LVQVQVRIPGKLVEEIDRWVAEGRFRSRSDAIKTILALYHEREQTRRLQTRRFYETLIERSREAKEKPEILVGLEDIP